MKNILVWLSIAVTIVLLIAVVVVAQTLNTGGVVYKITSTTGAVTYVPYDTVLGGQRYMARTGPWYSQAQLDSAKNAKVCPPAVDTTGLAYKWWRVGQNTKPSSVIFNTLDSSYTLH